jgi:hypothetical protein
MIGGTVKIAASLGLIVTSLSIRLIILCLKAPPGSLLAESDILEIGIILTGPGNFFHLKDVFYIHTMKFQS